MIPHFEATVVLVADLYLGSINHTLMSIEVLQNRKLKVKGIIFNGPENKESETIILKRSGFINLLNIPQEEENQPRGSGTGMPMS